MSATRVRRTATPATPGRADRAALHLACTASIPGDADAIGDHRPLTASDLMSLRLPMPPRVALLACGSGGDYQFDEATGLVAAMILGGAQLVTATLWSLPTTAAFGSSRQPEPNRPEVNRPIRWPTLSSPSIAPTTPPRRDAR